MEQEKKKDYGKGLAVGALLSAAFAGVLKLLDKHFAKKDPQTDK